ncbi:siderophore-interacting protein [Brevibacterium album]|uniref:siderophore-interacting protein n=1 Tax=Brevibacterium album TaxID=417948 RepID=UPI000411A626|nr:siderophore-interacting protein [Brevibacterium album]
MSLHDLLVHPLVVRTVTVAAVEDVTPRMRRIRLTGAELGPFTRDGHTHPGFSSPGFDDHVKLIFAGGGPLETALPRQLPDGIEWTPAPHRDTRDYTPRSFDPDAGELVLDFVMHGEGPAATWARNAAPGDPLSFVGPKSSLVLPREATSLVLIGDETALPALGRFFDERPLSAPAHVIALIAAADARQSLRLGPEDSVRWEHMPHPDGEAIAAAFDELVEDRDLGERPYVWAAGEAASLLPLRRRLSRVATRGDRSITGYWHRTEETEAAAAPALPASPTAWFAIRAALDLGLPQALAEEGLTAEALAAALAVPPARLHPLLEALVPAGLLDREAGGAWSLTGLGRDLLDDPHAQEEFTGPEAAQVLALVHTAEAVRSGTPAWELAHGSSFADALTDPATAGHLAHEAESLAFLQHGLVRRLAELDAHTLLGIGPAAEVLCEIAARGGVSVLPLTRGEVRTSAPEAGEEAGEDRDGTVIVSALLLHHLDDAAALAHLRALAAVAPRALLLDTPAPDALSPEAALRGLVRFGTSGAPARTAEDLAALARQAGWTPLPARGLGWGLLAMELVTG